jgi:thymidylate kinase
MWTVLVPPTMIHLFGPDGAGKSTQAYLLTAKLTSKNVQVRKYWTRSPHTLAYLLWELAMKIGFYETISGASGSFIKVPCVRRNRVLGRFWSLIELISVLPLAIRAKLYLFCGYTLVAERYIVDTIAFVSFSINDTTFPQSPMAKLFMKLIPKNTRFIFIDADYNTIRQRRAATLSWGASASSIKTEMEPQAFIDFQRAVYKRLAIDTNALVVNTAEHSQQDTFNLIAAYLHL